MVKIKVLTKINFDGKATEAGSELEITKDRFKLMQDNFKKQSLDINNYIEVIEVEPSPVKEQQKKRTRNQKK